MTQLESPSVSIGEPLETITTAMRPVTKPARGKDPMALPLAVDRTKIDWYVVGMFAVIHLAAAAVFVPSLFTWSGVIVAVATAYFCGCLGINVCYHRLLTHRSFTTPKWFERVLTCLSFCSMEGSSVRWIATHRMHHQHSDHQPDPHSPLVNFLWAHVGWMIVRNKDIDDYDTLGRYARDLTKDGFHNAMHKSNKWLLVWLTHVLLIAACGFAVGFFPTSDGLEGLRVALSWVVWGVFVRTVVVWHITWSINSVTHIWGYRNYKTTDDSRNNWLMGYLGFGEGWHNNHHADQRSAAAGHKWWEFDLAYLTIRLFKLFGLASNVVTPARNTGTAHDIGKKKL